MGAFRRFQGSRQLQIWLVYFKQMSSMEWPLTNTESLNWVSTNFFTRAQTWDRVMNRFSYFLGFPIACRFLLAPEWVSRRIGRDVRVLFTKIYFMAIHFCSCCGKLVDKQNGLSRTRENERDKERSFFFNRPRSLRVETSSWQQSFEIEPSYSLWIARFFSDSMELTAPWRFYWFRNVVWIMSALKCTRMCHWTKISQWVR